MKTDNIVLILQTGSKVMFIRIYDNENEYYLLMLYTWRDVQNARYKLISFFATVLVYEFNIYK